MNTCEYKAQNYFQGQQWQDGCDFQCTCTDSKTGHYECHDLCPKYPNLPSYCRLEKYSGSCCEQPVCEFNQQQGSYTGIGSVSGNGIDTLPPTLPPCGDVVDNCPMYGKGACTQYRSWALQNCRKFCDLCDVDRDPGTDDVCMYDGKQYHQGESWFVGCNMRCTCEKATQGYYRCDDLCPSYTNVPPTCKTIKPAGACCQTLKCGSGTFISSSNNLNTVGNGGNIFTGANYVPPTLVTGGQAPPGTGDSTDHAPSIPGCLYKGQVYVQDQRWDDACDLSCLCEDAATGRYKCRARCPSYPTPPAGCTMVKDQGDTCCSKPHCTGPAAATYIPIPVYGKYQSKGSVAQPPSPNQRFTGTGGNFGAHGGVVSLVQYDSTVPPPTVGNFSNGGIGFCTYKPTGKTYQQNENWEDGCDYNCVCDDASYGHYTCVEKCVVYTNIPQPFCKLIEDPANSCCQIPSCHWTAPYQKVTGLAFQQPTTVMARSTLPPTPAFAFCEYNGKHYDQNQIWYQGCNFKCTCEEPASNKYRCVSRCPEYENIDPSCTFEADPNDPKCCSIPRCGTPVPGTTLIPDPTAGAVTVPPGFVTGDNFPPGVTGGTITGYCEYNGKQYQQGEKWEDGCAYDCVCEDTTTGKYKCNEKCTRYDKVPAGCRLVSDFTNPCCKTLRCDPNSITGTPTPGTTSKPDPNNPNPTQGPTPGPNSVCVYKNVQYHQNEQWMDGCDQSCRCDNAATGVYSCTQRCPSYDSLPPECKLVTDPEDQCCLIPQCKVPTAVPTNAPQPKTPIPTPPPIPGVSTFSPPPIGLTLTPKPSTTARPNVFPTPTAVPGKVTGSAKYPDPTVGPNGEKPTPRTITICEYKGVQYQQAQKWTDGCTFNCECVNALQGKYECTERCPRYPNLPSECRLVKNIADPCCQVPECGPAPTPPSTTGSPIPNGATATPPLLPGQVTPIPNQSTTQAPPTTQKDVCVYKSKSYSQGQQWYDGCDYKCVCENGAQGLYTCSDRCPVYQSALPSGCSLVADPSDPFCCKVPECNIPPKFTNTSGYVFPTPPLAVVTGGSVTPLPTPPQSGPTPSTGTTLSPIPGESTRGPEPTIPNNVCVYNGRTYQQGQTWRDGCNYNCRCENAKMGHYQCTEICPKNPPSLPPQCRLVRDTTNPCCQKPYCDFTQTTPIPTPGTTLHPPTGPTGPTQYPPTPGVPLPTPKPGMCVYNGVAFKQDATWEDGCDLKCECENASTGYYRCNQRCPRYDHVDASCNLVADPRDSCCRVPLCPPVPSSTAQPTPHFGPTLHPPTTRNPNNPTPSVSGVPVLIPTAIPGKVEGVGVVPTPGVTQRPNPDNPFQTPAPTKAPGCLYKGVVYRQSQQFSDGCQYDCVCLDDKSGRYSCTEKCPLYPSIPPDCQLVNDPKNPCCKTPQCRPNPNLLPPTASPQPNGPTATPPTGSTVSPNPNNMPTPAPQKREVCMYMGKSYTQGQQWDDGCSKVCVCEDAKAGFHRCSDRCVKYDNIPAGCTLVADPNDPLCCQVPQCAPTPNPKFSNPTSGPQVVVTPPVGKVTGRAPVPIPTTAHPGDATPQPPVGCMYKGLIYRQTQKWQDGCDYNCVCVDEKTGAYSCTQRCPATGPAQPRCTLQQDPNDYCCTRQVCDFSQPTPTPGLPPMPNQQTTKSPNGQQTPQPGVLNTPKPTPPAVCVYQGVPYQQGASWKEGCSRTCRCEDAVNNLYSCFDRCPTYQLTPGCQLVTEPQDSCCQVPKCTILVTPSPTPVVPLTPFPNGTYPKPPPSKQPGLVPIISPSPVPTSIPGILTGTLPTPTGFCEYKGGRYTTGQKWDDGCDYRCECVDADVGQYSCTQRCPPYPSIPPYCVMVSDPRDQCCTTPYCPGLLTPAPQNTPSPLPVTVTPGTGPTPTGSGPNPTVGPTVSPGTHTTPVTMFPTFNVNVPVPTGTSNPVPKDSCVFMGKAYTQGQQWYDSCDKICVCEDGKTGFYSCTDRCAKYPNISPDCIMVADPKDPVCCQAPQCSPPTNPNVPPTGVIGVVTGNGLPPIPTPSPGAPTGPAPTPKNACVYKGNSYTTGQTWQDGCDLNCQCVDDKTGQYRCTDRCPRYPNLPTTCVLVYDPTDPCCKKPMCGDNRPTPSPTKAPTTGPNGETPRPLPTTPSPNAFCVYNGVPYRQGATWQVGCDKVCKCQDSMTRQITCNDRCPSFPVIQDGCMLKTDPMDSCCQILNCPPVLQPGTDILVPPIRGVINGGNQPKPNGIPSNVGGKSTCVYNGKSYTQGQSWDDGCSYTCVCVDELNGKYRCSEKCPRYTSLPATCTLVQDPKDPCCKRATCPELRPPTPSPTSSGPQPGSTPTGQVPTVGATPLPRDVCVYGNNYYKQGQQWYDGCDKICRCEDTSRNFYRCDERCAKFQGIPAGCTSVPDPKDPSCCKVPECPLSPSQGPSFTGSGFVRPSITPPPGVITGDGKIPTPVPTPTLHPGDTTPIPLPRTGCYFKNQVYQKGQKWDDGCDYTCECVDDMTGVYRCTDKCPPNSNPLPDPVRCKMVQDPQNPCCPVPYCDFKNPTPVFPTPGTTPPGGGSINYFTPPPVSGSGTKPPGFCVYQGVYYRQGDTWNNGCSQTCRCEDVTTGFYSCFERCKTFNNLPSTCTLKSDPADPCCVVPDCNIYPKPGQSFTNGPNGETPPPPTDTPVGVVGGTITGVGGNNPNGINPLTSNTGGGRSTCIYKGVAYGNGQTWDDGCNYKCECIDAARGQYRCSDRCTTFFFLPQGCHYVPDPKDQCCKMASCTGTPPPYSVSPGVTATPTPSAGGIVTVPQDKCVYKDGKQYSTGDTWNDGCSLSCKCDDASQGKYTCTERCPVFSSLPSYCNKLVPDPTDKCCKQPECTGHLNVLVGNNKPTLAPFLPPGVTNIVPLGSHVVINGRGPLTPSYTGPSVVGGRHACVYKNKAYRQGDNWEDGCDYVCVCDDQTTGDYTCTSKCPLMPPLPTYCNKINIPGQCCSSVQCNVPGHGAYNPIPELTAGSLPTPGPTQNPQGPHGTTPVDQIIVPVQGTITGGNNLPHGGASVPTNTNIGGLRGRCVTKDNKMYKQGETWSENCDYDCTCLDGLTGYYSCQPKCTSYKNVPAACTLVKEGCCDKPVCTKPDGTTVDLTKNPNATSIFPLTAVTTGGFTGFRPGYLATAGNSIMGSSQPGCVYKGSLYRQGDTWDDGCDFTCSCEDDIKRQFLCKPKCSKFTSVPSGCKLVKDPQGCCDLLSCPAVVTTVDPTCKDPLVNCPDYGKDSCTGQYEPWARRNCPHFCGYVKCGESTTSATPKVCEDKLTNCQQYAQDACTGQYEQWARQNCAKHCNLCPTTPPQTTNGCRDVLTDCLSYGKYACEPPYAEWARKNCNDTCGFCSKAVGAGGAGISGHSTGLSGVVGGQGSQIGAKSPSGWVTLLKGVHGVPNDDLFRLWAGPDTRNANNSRAMAPTDEFPGHYKSALSNYWDTCSFDQVKVSVWNKGQEKANIIFDARGTNKMNWFDPSRIISSTYGDIKTAAHAVFKLEGDPSLGREFYISESGQGCAGTGWIMVSTQDNCFYERAGSGKPTFYYAKGNTAGQWTGRAEGDVFMIAGRGGCASGNNTQNKPVCTYKGTEYHTGQTWQDGCDKNCTCRDGNLGYYQCDDLCRKYQSPLPQGCHLEKKPGECCNTLTCPFHPGFNGCYYKGTYYHQGDVWDDGCDYKCSCEDASTGFYTCKTKCVTWNLPSECYLQTPPTGKCCPVPVCPSGFVISYPPGYTQE
ncbi:uncharacterized protein [Littorina saxatilis]